MESSGVVRMVVLCAALFFLMKVVVLLLHRAEGGARLGGLRLLAFTLGWPGMRPGIFLGLGSKPLPGASRLIRDGLVRLGLGALLVALGRLVFLETGSRVLAALLLLPGLSLVVHFGALDVLAGAWRLVGVDAQRLFRAPLAAKSLGEFWGRRWNVAFTEMVTVAVYRPVSRLLGRGAGTFAAFAFSAFAHELALSVPARGGYGGPSLYFLLHGALVLVEKRAGWTPGRAWTLLWLALPLPLLFHGPCFDAVIGPLVGLVGAGGIHHPTH